MCRRVCVWVMCTFVQMPAEVRGIVFPGADWVQVTASHLMWVLGMDSGPLEEQCTSFSYLLSYFSSPLWFLFSATCLFSGDTLFGCNFQHASISSKLRIFHLFLLMFFIPISPNNNHGKWLFCVSSVPDTARSPTSQGQFSASDNFSLRWRNTQSRLTYRKKDSSWFVVFVHVAP